MSNSATPEAPLSAWDRGLTLREALATFTDPNLGAEYAELLGYLTPNLPPSDLPPQKVVAPAPLPYDPSTVYPRFLAVQERAQGAVLGMLKTGELLAVGYRVPRTRRLPPQWISAERWAQGRVSWNESQLWTDSEIFEEIRIVESIERTAAAIAATITSATASRRRGRPSKRERIMDAYRGLRDAGKIDFSALHLNYASVRELVLRMTPDQSSERGLSNEAIRSAISAEFKRDQKTQSATEK